LNESGRKLENSGESAPAKRYRVSSPKVIRESFEGEVILVHLDTGTYYSLRGTGATLWELLAASASFSEIAGQFVSAYGVSNAVIEVDLQRFIAELLAEDLLSEELETVSAPSVAPVTVGSGVAYQEPVLEKFSDMQELLLLDPVHEVGQDGWPLREEDAAKLQMAKNQGPTA
jgi:hypothetical protein